MAATLTGNREQQLAALARANEVRLYRCQLKRDVKAGTVDATNLVAEPPADAASMPVIDLLLAMPKTGRVKANTMLRRVGASNAKTLAGLSDRQRAELLSLLGSR